MLGGDATMPTKAAQDTAHQQLLLKLASTALMLPGAEIKLPEGRDAIV